MRTGLLGGVAAVALLAGFQAQAAEAKFEIPAQPLDTALREFGVQSGMAIMADADVTLAKRSPGFAAVADPETALHQLLTGTGLTFEREGDVFVVAQLGGRGAPQASSAAGGGAEVEALIVTAQKREEDIQDVPIAISAFTQEMLTERQVAGGPDLITQIPNFTFTKTNFSGYSIQIRGIGTQAISATTDPAVAVAFNGTPFIRNHFFEQEFYDVSSVEVARGPQGTLFGRNATAGVVNIVSAKPTYRFESRASADLGNYHSERLEGMVNIPLIEDKLALRVAGEWTKREGYSYNETTNRQVDGRDLWSTRLSLRYEPVGWLRANLVWERFQEDDDRIRSGKQLCKKDPAPDTVNGQTIEALTENNFNADEEFVRAWLTQGCLPTSLYSDEAFQTPNGHAISIVAAGQYFLGGDAGGQLLNDIDPYASQTQSRDLRVFQSALDPTYRVRHDTWELNVDLNVTPRLTLTSQTGYAKDTIRSTQDFNRFNTAPGIFADVRGYGGAPSPIEPGGVYCDPQLGCSTAMVGSDLSRAHGRQFSQEFRLASDFAGPINFSVGANFLRYKTEEDYYVFFNLLTAAIQATNGGRPGHYEECYNNSVETITISPDPYYFDHPVYGPVGIPSNFSCGQGTGIGTYLDPNPIDQLDGLGHNYFRSKNPYRLTSKAVFGEVYYQLTPDLKLTGGLRWTNDRKLFAVHPSMAYLIGGGYPQKALVDQEWSETTGRFVADWSPDLKFTDDTMIYGSYARGYKAGGANPPGPERNLFGYQAISIVHPETFEPEFVDAFEFGAKNRLLNDTLTINANAFYYDYKGYQISQIVDRTSINLNFDAEVKGLEIEGSWRASEALSFNFTGGLQETSVGEGQSAVDLMDRTAGQPGWVVVKPFITDTSNCILPETVVRGIIEGVPYVSPFDGLMIACGSAYNLNSPFGETFGFTNKQVIADLGFDASTAPNGGAGFAKDLGGNQLPNAPKFSVSLGSQFSIPMGSDWVATFRGDAYWAGNSYARIFNDEPYDKLRHRTNLNLAAILTGGDGWMVMGYVKNVFDDDFITGAFLNSDDTALTTNVFLNEPRLFGVRITKSW